MIYQLLPVFDFRYGIPPRPLRSAPVKGLSRHILGRKARPPVFHDSLDRLAFLRMKIVPITGSQTQPGVIPLSLLDCTQEGRSTTFMPA